VPEPRERIKNFDQVGGAHASPALSVRGTP